MSKTLIPLLTSRLQKNKAVSAALVYGSYADEKRVHAESDVDIGLILDASIHNPDEYIWEVINDLSNEFYPVHIDAVNLQKIDPILGFQILKSYKILFDPLNLVSARLAELMVVYLDFKITRKVIEDNIGKKKIYG